MRILNLGSLNYDKVYHVDDFVRAGETILANGFDTFCGGKGLNQSIAAAKAGARVCHAGAVGPDGGELLDMLDRFGVDRNLVQTLSIPSGHALIQINRKGQNCIIVSSSANGAIGKSYIDQVLTGFGKGDILLLQNEVSNVGYAMEKAKAAGLKIALNPSPITDSLHTYPLDLVDYFLLNEVEGRELSGVEDFSDVLSGLSERYPSAGIVLTVGSKGVLYKDHFESAEHGVYPVKVIDTTAAGDTFCGYFLAGLLEGMPVSKILEFASKASSIAVSRPGAAASIPVREEVLAFPGR